MFESKEKIALLDFSNDVFQLVEKYDAVSKTGNPVVIDHLPRASPEKIFYDSDKKSMYSHIYL